ncbi:pyruvate ferredoxin oxidoreductase [Limnohabitans sp. T6-5]|uniref:indolepyruvate ferredoxin oxidoreductase family protein n=1 Tax=Limnohabitans sp. T6-5 TaxID=1100724 RepID=UPI000D3DC009|nr:indolepyruvate ferredoxin oxidoreductase family protein [Limnohabitans sp. T6-5]PUE06787.1 pyruvate ferredoxin oxidoreductase [Limnohabitans sp. T6-5]
MSETPTVRTPDLRDYQLQDSVWAQQGSVFLSGTQALVRIMLMQRQHDERQHWNTRGFISGYRGSPLGMVDQVIWEQGRRFNDAGIEFVPAINEELGATQVLGTQRVESDPQRTVDGVFGLWYGKGPGVDRAGDALKHGNTYGSSPHGGVLVVAGDDHGCVSSSMPHQSDQVFQSWHMPVVSPADVSELVSFGLYGFVLSRYSGAWVGMTALSEVVESSTTVDLDAITAQQGQWKTPQKVQALTGHVAPADGLHYRWPDLPSLRIESRLQDKLNAVAAFAQVNSIDRQIIVSPQAHIGIVTAGKAHHDLMEVFRRLGLSEASLAAAGVRVIKLGLTFPIEPTRMQAFAQGLREMLVVEEKAPIVEQQLRDLFYNVPSRPGIVGKCDVQGQPLLSALGELRPSRLIVQVANWLQQHTGSALNIPLLKVRDFVPAEMLSNASDAVKRLPYFCAGCPHNTSTKVPEGSTARAGIGCHFMANWMERDTAGLIQMGGEGVDWVSHSRFTRTPHVFQNLGDGTYYHSGYLAIRQAVAAKARITYKILYNDAVAMTGGQPIDGVISVDAIARQVESEGVQAVAIVSDHIEKFNAIKNRFPSIATFHPREDLDEVQRQLREVTGVSVLIYEQTCAAELRRRRKKGEMVDPARRLMIHEGVCEGCGDCGVQSNCVAVLPHETRWGRKRKIDQTHCNKDYSCAKGFCPSFVSVIGGRLRRKTGASPEVRAQFMAHAARLPDTHPRSTDSPWDLLITGVGGTGVVTVGAVIAMAAHLEGQHASVLDFMGFAQKGGSVLSFVRIAPTQQLLNQVRIDTQQADAVLACDAVVAASPEALQTIRHGRTRVLVNVHETPVADAVRHPDAELQTDLLIDKMRFSAGDAQVETFDAQVLAEQVLGDTLASNILAMGYAWQRGLVPVSLAALEQAIRLNNVAVETNLLAFTVGRLAAADPSALSASATTDPVPEDLNSFIDQAARHLTAYQNAAWAQCYRRLMRDVQAAGIADDRVALTVARSLHKLMSYKDEYEVARLFSDTAFQAQLDAQFEGDYRLAFHMSPPVLFNASTGKVPRKITLGAWMRPLLGVLAHGKRLRGTGLDPFGYTHERRMERQLINAYIKQVQQLLPLVMDDNTELVLEILALPLSMRGFGHVKARNVRAAQSRQAWLLHRLDPTRYPRPQEDSGLQQLRGIAIRSV